MTPWHACRLYAPGASTPVRVATVVRGAVRGVSAGRIELLRGWAEGDRRKVVRVVGEPGEDLAPADVDWSGIPGGEPARRVGRPSTGQETKVTIRCAEDERDAWQAAAERAGASIGVWSRAALVAAARRRGEAK